MKTFVLSTIFAAFVFLGASSAQAQFTMTPKGIVPNANNEVVTEYDIMLKEDLEEGAFECCNREYAEMLQLESELVSIDEADTEADAQEDAYLDAFASKDENGAFEFIAAVESDWDANEDF